MPGFFQFETDPAEYELSPERRDALLHKIAHEIVRRNLTAPAIFFLESIKPLSFIGSQVMVFFDPLIRAVFDLKGYNDVRLALERRENIELLLRTIEDYDAERIRARREAKKKSAATG